MPKILPLVVAFASLLGAASPVLAGKAEPSGYPKWDAALAAAQKSTKHEGNKYCAKDPADLCAISILYLGDDAKSHIVRVIFKLPQTTIGHETCEFSDNDTMRICYAYELDKTSVERLVDHQWITIKG